MHLAPVLGGDRSHPDVSAGVCRGRSSLFEKLEISGTKNGFCARTKMSGRDINFFIQPDSPAFRCDIYATSPLVNFVHSEEYLWAKKGQAVFGRLSVLPDWLLLFTITGGCGAIRAQGRLCTGLLDALAIYCIGNKQAERNPMKTSITAIALTIAAPAYAEENNCAAYGGLAETVMSLRQKGVPMSAQMGISGVSKTVEWIIMEAYKKPRYNSEELKQNTIADFRNDVELFCYESNAQRSNND